MAEQHELDVIQPAASPSQAQNPESSLPKVADANVQPAVRRPVIEGKTVIGISEADETFYLGFDKKRRKRVRSKIDWRLLPILSILYLFATLDRANIANAKIEGLKEDTAMTDKQYSTVLAVFFIPYCLLELPSNMVLKSLKRPSIYLSGLALAWGLVMMCHTFARSFGHLLVLRLLLGATEAGFFPGAMYLCSFWYEPHALAVRLSLFMAVSASSGAFSGLLAAGIGTLGGKGNLASWQWIFLLEGCATILLGLVSMKYLVDTPSRSGSWLEEDEIRYLHIQKFVKDGGLKNDAVEEAELPHRKFHFWAKLKTKFRFQLWASFNAGLNARLPSKFKATLVDLEIVTLDLRTWTFGVFLHCVGACSYGLKFVVPTIIKGMGYSRGKAQLFSALPYMAGAVSSVVVSLASDKLQLRAVFAAAGFSSIMIGQGILFHTINSPNANIGVAIVGMSMITCGVFPMAPMAGSWISNNTRTSSQRAIALSLVMAIGAVGGISGSYMYREDQAPYYQTGQISSLALAGAGLVIVALLAWSYRWENKKMDRNREALEGAGTAQHYFRYTL